MAVQTGARCSRSSLGSFKDMSPQDQHHCPALLLMSASGRKQTLASTEILPSRLPEDLTSNRNLRLAQLGQIDNQLVTDRAEVLDR